MSRQNRADSAQANSDGGGLDFLDFLRSAGGTVPLAHDRSPSQQNQRQRLADQRLIESLSHRRSTPYFSHGGHPRQSRNDPAARDQSFAASLAHHRSARHHYQEQQPQQQNTNDSAERKRRHTGLEHARRTYPYPGHLAGPPGASGASRSSSHNDQQVIQQAGASVEAAIDLTSSSPSRPTTRPSYSRMDSSNGSGGSGIVQALSARRRQNSERQNSDTALPPWQPDNDVSKCPVCATDFSLIYRRHHCRKCGRVVCAHCSPHRITIPRQYIVHPPEHRHLYTTYTNAESTVDANNPPLCGGEVVRVCNPCVPDPWHPNTGAMPSRPTPRVPLPGGYANTSSLFTDEELRLTDEELQGDADAAPRTHAPTKSDLMALRNQLPPNFNRPPDFNRPQDPMPLGGRNRSQSHQQTSNPSELTRLFASSSNADGPSRHIAPPDPQPSRPRQRSGSHLTHGPSSHGTVGNDRWNQLLLDNADAEYHRQLRADFMRRATREAELSHLHLEPGLRPTYAGTVSPILRTDPHPTGRNPVHSPVVPRRQVAEEDECPVCGEEMPPGEASRERHIEECIASRMAPQSTSPPPVPTTAPGNASAEASRPRGASFRPRGMAKSVATEKDCIDGDGEPRECSICLEEYVPGDELGRMECLCVFHSKCIREWWAQKGMGACPTPHFD